MIALLWTLLRQSPAGPPAVKRAVVVCPAGLVDNWAAEVKKWLSPERLATTTVRGGGAKAKAAATTWAVPAQRASQVLVTSFESLRGIAAEVAAAQPGILVCDEGHRLKGGGAKTLAALRALSAPRRIILTGTPSAFSRRRRILAALRV